MRTIFLRKPFEDKTKETIVKFFNMEGYEGKEVKPYYEYGYKINTNYLYRFTTDKGNIYFVEDGDVTETPTI